MRFLCADLFAETHGDHLEQPRRQALGVFRMRLDPSEHEDAIGRGSQPVEVSDGSGLGRS